MLLCAVVRAYVTASFGAFVQILLFLSQSSSIWWVQASLPPGAEDEIILIEHLPGRRVHLQDFFWTGTDDAPPWVDPSQSLTIYETKTIYHTVTIYPEEPRPGRDPSGSKDPDLPPVCVNCIEPTPKLDENDDIGILIGDDPGPRYWLLTVLREGEAVPPKIELRLARLYRAAFMRQQQRHLGLLSNDPRARRAARNRVNGASISNGETPEKMESLSEVGPTRLAEILKLSRSLYPPIEDETEISGNSQRKGERSLGNLIMNESLTLNDTSGVTSMMNVKNETGNGSSPITSRLRSLDRSVALVQVRMQNTSVTESGATKLIYSVHLGGKPVPAEIAARDMALISEQEVALELGAPVIIQSEPYLKETQPLALSRNRDTWLVVGAAGGALLLLAIVIVGLIFAAKRKRAHTSAVAPPNRSILKKEYTSSTPGVENTGFSSSETEGKSDGTSQRRTPGSFSRTPITTATPRSLEGRTHELSSDNEEDQKARDSPWRIEERTIRQSRINQGRMTRSNAMDRTGSPDSMDSVVGRLETLDSIENGYARQDETAASPHSYLSMTSCKQFPNMRSVEPLSRVLEPVMVRHLDLDSPDLSRRDDSRLPEYREEYEDDRYLARTSSASRDPGVVGPIVWNLRRQGMPVEEDDRPRPTDLEPGALLAGAPSGPVGRARRRLHELLEDSFSLFGSRDPTKGKESQPAVSDSAVRQRASDALALFSDNRGKSAHVSPVATPTTEVKTRPRTSLPRKGSEDDTPSIGHLQPRGAWGSRPLSAGPFHRPNLPEVDVRRVLVDSRLPPEDPAVPLIASIKKELSKFT